MASRLPGGLCDSVLSYVHPGDQDNRADQGRAARRPRLEARAWADPVDDAGCRCHHRHRHLRSDRSGGRRERRARPSSSRWWSPASSARSRRSATRSSPRACRSPGSAYTYAYATLGEFVAWVIGWDLILEYALGAATVAVGWSGNLVTLSPPARPELPGGAQRRARDDCAGSPAATR